MWRLQWATPGNLNILLHQVAKQGDRLSLSLSTQHGTIDKLLSDYANETWLSLFFLERDFFFLEIYIF